MGCIGVESTRSKTVLWVGEDRGGNGQEGEGRGGKGRVGAE